MQKNAKFIFMISIFLGAMLFGVYGYQYYQDQQDPDDNTNSFESYSWKDDPNRQQLSETAENLTLIVEYGNDTTFTLSNITLTDHYTSVYDLLNQSCEVTINIIDLGDSRASFYVTAIDGLKESISTNKFWFYYVNNQYAAVGCNIYGLTDNAVIRWAYTSPYSPT